MPLSGIRVIDAGQILAAPFCATLLAEFGAEVIKVEPPGAGESNRGSVSFAQELEHPGRTALLAARAGADLVSRGYHMQVMPHASSDEDAQDIELVVEEGSVATTLDEDEVVFVDEEDPHDDEDTVEEQPPAAATANDDDSGPALELASAPPAAYDEEEFEVPEPLREALEEIDFYLKQEMQEEAESMLADALQSFGEHPLLLQQQRMMQGEAAQSSAAATPSLPPSGAGTQPGLGKAAGPQASAALKLPPPVAFPAATTAAKPKHKSEPPRAAAREDRSFELAQKLAEEVTPDVAASSGSDVASVADVLAQFKEGVARQVDKSDSATHYDLGIAYMEMGLHGEAIEEFKLCLTDPARTCMAHTMIGLSYVAKAEMELGIQHIKQALQENPRPEEELSLWFEMGNAFELLGKKMEALVWYEKVEERDPRFRDVVQRVERLGTARTPEQESDDFDEMFDNMILKD